MNVEPLSNFGADITGIDLDDVDQESFAKIEAAWLEHAVIRFRGQDVDNACLQEFSARFGPLEYAPLGKITDEERARIADPFVTNISNIVVDGRPIGGLGSAEAAWHTDMSYIEHPPTASVLYALEVPESGGDTYFCDMRAAFRILPAALTERLRGLTLKHDAAHDSIGKLRRGFDDAPSPEDAPGWIHPIVLTHPETGVESLYLGRRQDAFIPGLSLSESESLLDETWSYVAREEHCWTQHWRVGDIVVWDNRSVMHRRAAFPSSSRRLMRRTQVRPRVGRPGSRKAAS